MKKSEELFDAIGQVDDRWVIEAEPSQPSKKVENIEAIKARKGFPFIKRHWAELAASLMLVIVFGFVIRYAFIGGMGSSDETATTDTGNSSPDTDCSSSEDTTEECCESCEDGSTGAFNNYEGPVVNLQIMSEENLLTASRNIAYIMNRDEASVSDAYSLTNNSEELIQTELIYPFIAGLDDPSEYFPSVTLNGEQVEPKISISDICGGFTADGMNLAEPSKWKDYEVLFENDDFMNDAMENIAEAESAYSDIAVTVYTISNAVYPSDQRAATLAFEFESSEDTLIMTYNMNGASIDDSNRRYSFFVSGADDTQRIIVVGDPLESYTLKGYEDGGCDKELEGVSGDLDIEVTNLNAVLKEVITEFRLQPNNVYMEALGQNQVLAENFDAYILSALVEKLSDTAIGGGTSFRYYFMGLDELMMDAISMKRIMYYSYPLEIEAGATVEVEFNYNKGANYDYDNYNLFAYDIGYVESPGLQLEAWTIQIENEGRYKLESEDISFEMVDGVYEGVIDITKGYYSIYMIEE